MIIRKIGKRITLSLNEVIIRTPIKYFVVLFLPIWLVGWTAGGFFSIYLLSLGKIDEPILILLFLFTWFIIELLVLYIIFWNLFGKEIVSIRLRKLIIRRVILGIGFRFVYEIDKITGLRASGFFAPMFSWEYNLASWGFLGGTIAFEYEGKTKRFGLSLSEDDSKKLLKYIKKQIKLSL